jgi:hypothetical protein
LVPLIYRADWAALSLSATVTSWTDPALDIRLRNYGRRHAAPDPGPAPAVIEHSYQVLLAPGGKYRVSHVRDGKRVHEGCDGVTAWTTSAGSAGAPGLAGLAQAERRKGGPWPVLDDLQNPARLLTRFTLEMTGPDETGTAESGTEQSGTEQSGTEQTGSGLAYRVTGRLRPLSTYGQRPQAAASMREVRLLVDAGTGVLLSYEELFEGQPVRRTGLGEVRLDPPEAADGTRFAPPPGIERPEEASAGPREARPGSRSAMSGRPGDAVRGAAGLAANAMGFAVRHWPQSSAPRAGAAGPGASGPMNPVPLDPQRLEPVSDQVINLLNGTGQAAPHLAAEVHERISGRLLTEAISRLRGAMPTVLDGILGPDALWDAVEARDNSADRVKRLRLGGAGRYRIDHVAGDRSSDPETIGCDGDRQWQVSGSRVTARSARPLSREFSCLVDPVWLLGGDRLWAGGETGVGGRRGFVVVGRRRHPGELPDPEYFWPGSPADQVEAVVDADLAVLVRLTGFLRDELVISLEMRDLVASVADAGAFDVPPGARGGPLANLGLTPVGAAKTAAGLGAFGAAAVVGWLQKRPRS